MIDFESKYLVIAALMAGAAAAPAWADRKSVV